MHDDTLIKAGLSCAGAALAALWASVGTAWLVLFAVMVMDTLTAMIANGRLHQLSPEAGAYGWRRKSITLILVLTLAILQQGVDPGVLAAYGVANLPAAQFLAGLFTVIEAMSVVRNYIYCGGYMPKLLADALGIKELPPTKPPEGVAGFLGSPRWWKPTKEQD